MGDWQHPAHYTESAKAFQLRTRKAEIAVFMSDVLPLLRQAARVHGYALTVHGSLARDLDLVAIPWTDGADAPDAVINAIAAVCKQNTGWGQLTSRGATEAKPHGRVALTILATDNVHLDLSVMPRIEPQSPPA